VSEEGDRNQMDAEERVAWEQEKAARRAEWEAERKAEAERRERQEKRDRLQAHLRRRKEAWTEHTGTPPPSGMLMKWAEEYLNEAVAAWERDLDRRRSQAANDFFI
jgi:hypothetical protein